MLLRCKNATRHKNLLERSSADDAHDATCLAFLNTSANLSSYAWGEPTTKPDGTYLLRNFEIGERHTTLKLRRSLCLISCPTLVPTTCDLPAGVLALGPALTTHGFDQHVRRIPTPFDCSDLRRYSVLDSAWDEETTLWHSTVNEARIAELTRNLHTLLDAGPKGRPLHLNHVHWMAPDLNASERHRIHARCDEINSDMRPRRCPDVMLRHETCSEAGHLGYGCRPVKPMGKPPCQWASYQWTTAGQSADTLSS